MHWVFERLKIWFGKKDQCPMDPGHEVILAVIRTIARTGKGAALFSATGGQSLFPILLGMSGGTLIQDIITIVNGYGELPCELSSLKPGDYRMLIDTIRDEFGFSIPEAKRAVSVAKQLVTDVKENPIRGDG